MGLHHQMVYLQKTKTLVILGKINCIYLADLENILFSLLKKSHLVDQMFYHKNVFENIHLTLPKLSCITNFPKNILGILSWMKVFIESHPQNAEFSRLL